MFRTRPKWGSEKGFWRPLVRKKDSRWIVSEQLPELCGSEFELYTPQIMLGSESPSPKVVNILMQKIWLNRCYEVLFPFLSYQAVSPLLAMFSVWLAPPFLLLFFLVLLLLLFLYRTRAGSFSVWLQNVNPEP